MVLVVEPSGITGIAGDRGFLNQSFEPAAAYNADAPNSKNLVIEPAPLTAAELLRGRQETSLTGQTSLNLDSSGKPQGLSPIIRGNKVGFQYNDGNMSARVTAGPNGGKANFKLDF